MLCIMSAPCHRVIKDEPTNIMVEIRSAVPRTESTEFPLSFARALADLIKQVNPTVQRPKSKEPRTPRHLSDDLVKIQ